MMLSILFNVLGKTRLDDNINEASVGELALLVVSIWSIMLHFAIERITWTILNSIIKAASRPFIETLFIKNFETSLCLSKIRNCSVFKKF